MDGDSVAADVAAFEHKSSPERNPMYAANTISAGIGPELPVHGERLLSQLSQLVLG
jgi:hypothetical protein